MRVTIGRRDFLGAIGAAASIWTSLRYAQSILFARGIGRVAYCRAATEEWLALAREICPEITLIAEVDPAGVPGAAGAVFLGSEATLIVGRSGCQVVP
jgi:hypothetical protein